MQASDICCISGKLCWSTQTWLLHHYAMPVQCSKSKMAQSMLKATVQTFPAGWGFLEPVQAHPRTTHDQLPETHHAPHTHTHTYTPTYANYSMHQPKTPNTPGKSWPPSWPSRSWPRSWQHRAKIHRREVLWPRPRLQRWRWCSWDRQVWNWLGGRSKFAKGAASSLFPSKTLFPFDFSTKFLWAHLWCVHRQAT